MEKRVSVLFPVEGIGCICSGSVLWLCVRREGEGSNGEVCVSGACMGMCECVCVCVCVCVCACVCVLCACVCMCVHVCVVCACVCV